MSSKPFSVIVEAEIKEDRMEEFMKMIENNALKSRQEPGCIRFGMSFLHQIICTGCKQKLNVVAVMMSESG